MVTALEPTQQISHDATKLDRELTALEDQISEEADALTVETLNHDLERRMRRPPTSGKWQNERTDARFDETRRRQREVLKT